MKELIQLNTDKLITTFETTKKFQLTEPYTNSKLTFTQHCLTTFSKIPLYRNEDGKISMSSTIKNLKSTELSKEKLVDLLWIFKNVPRSKLMTASQITKPIYGSMTPIFMYAHKLYNDIGYEQWDARDTKINVALGDFLAKAMNFRKAYPSFIFPDTSRVILAKDKKYTDWNPYLKLSVTLDPVDGEEEGEVVRIPKELIMMKYQFWIANADIRNTDSMLLDIYNFGMTPIALDATPPKVNGIREL